LDPEICAGIGEPDRLAAALVGPTDPETESRFGVPRARRHRIKSQTNDGVIALRGDEPCESAGERGHLVRAKRDAHHVRQVLDPIDRPLRLDPREHLRWILLRDVRQIEDVAHSNTHDQVLCAFGREIVETVYGLGARDALNDRDLVAELERRLLRTGERRGVVEGARRIQQDRDIAGRLCAINVGRREHTPRRRPA